MHSLAIPNFNILTFPRGDAQRTLERVSRMFTGAFQKPFQSAFVAGEQSAGSITLLYDTFTATNGTTLHGRAPSPTNVPSTTCAVLTGAITIENNKAQSSVFSLCTYDAGVANGTIFAVVQSNNVTTSAAPGLFVRAADANNGWEIIYFNGDFLLRERNAGVVTLRDSDTVSLSQDTDYTIRVVLNGTSILATLDGSHSLSYSSSFQQSTTKHGLFLFAANGFICKADDFTVLSA